MMLQLVTDAVISKGYGGAPAFYSSEDGRMISFKIGCKVYLRTPTTWSYTTQRRAI